MAYITVSEAKDHIGGIQTSDDDVVISRLIDEAQALIERETGRVFEVSSDSAKTFDAVADVEDAVLYLGDEDLASITSITNGDSTTVTSSEYVTEPRRRTPYYAIRLLGSAGIGWTYGDDAEDAISITGRWGYSTTPPNDIVWACKSLVSWLYRNRNPVNDADRPIITAAAVIAPATMPAHIATALKKYRRY